MDPIPRKYAHRPPSVKFTCRNTWWDNVLTEYTHEHAGNGIYCCTHCGRKIDLKLACDTCNQLPHSMSPRKELPFPPEQLLHWITIEQDGKKLQEFLACEECKVKLLDAVERFRLPLNVTAKRLMEE